MKLFITALMIIFFYSSAALAVPVGNACTPPILTGFTVVNNSVTFPGNAVYSGDIYVFGSVNLIDNSGNNKTTYKGSIYATGNIYVGKNVTVTGFAYAEGVLTQHNNGNVQVLKGTCSGGVHIDPPPPIDLPVDELVGQCNDIFPDAVQSFSSSGELYMQDSTQILNSQSNSFPFNSEKGDSTTALHDNSCGSGVKCTIKSPPSQTLSSFVIPAISGEIIGLWSGESITVGGGGEYNKTNYQQITAGEGSTVTFLKKDYALGEMYLIDRLIVQANATIRLEEGVYAVRELTLNPSSQLEVIGQGDVLFFIQQGASNTDLNLQGEIDSGLGKFYFIANRATRFNSADSINASIYINGDLILDGSINIHGQTSSSSLKIRGTSKVFDVDICSPPVDDKQFVIVTQPSALTCEPHPVTLQVLKSDGTLDTDYVGLVNLTTTPALGDWSMENDNGRLNNATSNDGAATYEFNSSDNGEIALLLAVTSVTDVSVVMSQGGLASDAAPISFQSSMIKVQQNCTNPIAGQCINIANRPFALTLTAVKSDQSQVCMSYDPSNIAFWSEYVTPSNAALAVEIDDTAIGKAEAAAVALPIVFSAGVATVVANYPDAGEIKIHLKDTDITDIRGQITSIVNPLKVVIDSLTEHARNKEAGRIESAGAFIRASVPDYSDLQVDTFDLTTKAIIDCTTEGKSKNCPSIGDKVYKVAPSFSSKLTLKPSAISPYTLGSLSYKDSLQVTLNRGEFIYTDLAYSEVGTLGLQLEVPDYLIAGNRINIEAVKEIGHFYPDYIAYGNYQITPACNDDFTYLGQKAAQINYTLQAYQQAKLAAVTTNYDRSLGYAVAPTLNFSDAAYDKAPLSLTERLLRDSYYDQVNWNAGVYSVSGQPIGIDRILNSPDGPYELSNNNLVDYFIKLIGHDGEKIKHASNNGCVNDLCPLGDLGNLVYGRLQAGNGHGSEYAPIRTLIEATYFDGSDFVPFSRDNCTSIVNLQLSAKPNMSSSNEIVVGSGKTKLSVLNNPLITGKSYFEFSAPDNRGKLDYFIRLKDLSNANLYAPWLLEKGNAVACPDEKGPLKDCISGYVEFGLFRGNDRIIYRMQTFK